MNDKVLEFLVWLQYKKKVALCKEVRANPFFDKYVPLSFEAILEEYHDNRPITWDGILLPIRDDSLLDNIMPFRCPKCGSTLEWLQGDSGEGDFMSCYKCDYSWFCDDWL